MNSATVFLAVFEISTRSLYVLVPTSTVPAVSPTYPSSSAPQSTLTTSPTWNTDLSVQLGV